MSKQKVKEIDSSVIRDQIKDRGFTIRRVVKELGIHETTFYTWLKNKQIPYAAWIELNNLLCLNEENKEDTDQGERVVSNLFNLLSCPFCGKNTAILDVGMSGNYKYSRIVCETCGCQTKHHREDIDSGGSGFIEMAIINWNTRNGKSPFIK